MKALREGWIAGAGLDVFPMEPPPPDHPIFELTNVVTTPHTSSWAASGRRGLLNVVDKQRGY